MKGRSMLSYLITLCVVFALALAVPMMARAGSTEDWVARYEAPDYDSVKAIAVDSEGNVYVAGSTVGGGTTFDWLTLKYDSEGNQKWAAPYKGPDEDYPEAIAVDSEGNVYVTGTSRGSETGKDYVTIKYSQPTPDSYNEDWVRLYNGTENQEDYAYAIAVDSDGNVYVTGESNGEYGDTNDFDYATIKYDSDGIQKWVASYDGLGNGHDTPVSIAVNSEGNVYVTGTSRGSGTGKDYATIKYSQPTPNSYNQDWVARYNGSGNREDEAHAIAIDAKGNVYVTGTSWGSGTGGDYATLKYDSDGIQKWVARYNGPWNSWDSAEAMAVDLLGNVYITGRSPGSGTDFDYATIKYSQPTEDSYNEEWVQRYNGPGSHKDEAWAIAVNSSGTVYVTGSSLGSGTGEDYATVKYDISGTQLWVGRYNGPGNSWDSPEAMALDSLGNVYVTGTSLGYETSRDFATIKYSQPKLYAEKWVARYNGPADGDDYANAIAIDAEGNVYVTGNSLGGETIWDIVTVKYDLNGNELWKARYEGPGYDEASAIATDASGNVYVTGISDGNGTGYDYATVKYDASGTPLWVGRYNGPGNGLDSASAIVLDASGNVYVTGRSDGNGTGQDYVTIKYSQPTEDSYNEDWVARYEGPGYDEASAIATDASGNVYVTGMSDGNGTGYDYATVKYDASGTPLWVGRYNGPGNGLDSASAIALDASGNVYVTGRSDGNGTGQDYVTIKYSQPTPDSYNEDWVARYEGPGHYEASAIAVDASGNVYVTGGSDGNGTGYDYATVKYDTNGNAFWNFGDGEVAARYNGPENGDDYANAIAIDSEGNVYVAGSSAVAYGIADSVTVKYDSSSGEQVWEARYNSPGDGDDGAWAIAVDDASGNVYVTGWNGGDWLGIDYDYATIKYSQVSNTYAGGVAVDAVNGVTVTFEGEITKVGNTTATMTDQGPSPPTGFELAGTYCEITTTATYDGPIKICIVYDDSNLSLGQEKNLNLKQYNEATDDWDDVTKLSQDIDANIICSLAEHLSLFGLMYPVYQFNGFLPPVSPGKRFKLRRTVPVKFQLTDANGNYVTTALATLTLQRYVGDEPVGDPIVLTSTSAANAGNIFRYDLGKNQYIYNLRTKDLQRGTYLMTVALDDGEEHTTFISFR